MSINSVRPCRKTSPDHLRVLFLCNESHRAWRGRHSAHVPRAFCQILLSGYTRGITSTPDVSRARDSAVCLSPHVMPHVISRLRDIRACPRREWNPRAGVNANNLNSTPSFCREKNLNYLSIRFASSTRQIF